MKASRSGMISMFVCFNKICPLSNSIPLSIDDAQESLQGLQSVVILVGFELWKVDVNLEQSW